MSKINLKDLTDIEIHQLLYKCVKHLNNIPCVYDSKNNFTYYNYRLGNTIAYSDYREERERIFYNK